MKDKILNNKVLIIILVMLLIGIVSAVGTYTYFAWNSTGENKDTTVTVSSVDGLGQCDKISDNNKTLLPIASKQDGRIITINAKQTLSEYASITWTLTINSINREGTSTSGLKHQTFKYELVNSSTGVSYGSGNFSNVINGSTITLSNATEKLAYNRDYTFVLYIWIDGTMGTNPMDMLNQTFSFDLACDMSGSLYELNRIDSTLITGTNTQYFLSESLLKNTIESFDVINDEIPAGITPIDISEDHNGKVLLWYQDSDSDGLNEVHIKSDTTTVFISGTSLAYLFANLTNATSINLANLVAPNVTNIDGMFSGCSSLSALNFDAFAFEKVTSYTNVFSSVPTSVDINVDDCVSLLTFEHIFGYNYSNLHTSNNVKSCFTEHRASDSYLLNGTIKFDGTNYIDTGINLFSPENINKDFEISLTVQKYITNSITQSTVVNLKDESQSNSWPGAAYRKKSSTNTFEFTARWPGQTSVSIDDTSSFPKVIGFSRRNGVIYYSLNNSNEAVLINTPPASLTTAFNANLTFGASTNNGTPFRFFTGIVSDISVHLY